MFSDAEYVFNDAEQKWPLGEKYLKPREIVFLHLTFPFFVHYISRKLVGYSKKICIFALTIPAFVRIIGIKPSKQAYGKEVHISVNELADVGNHICFCTRRET